MDEAMARQILVQMGEEGFARVSGDTVMLDGWFRSGQLMALVWWLQNKPGEKIPGQA